MNKSNKQAVQKVREEDSSLIQTYNVPGAQCEEDREESAPGHTYFV
jgi:hypothetical protein